MSDKETLFSAKNRGLLLGPLSKNNPVLVQILGICSALAVTCENGTGHRDGSFGYSRNGIL